MLSCLNATAKITVSFGIMHESFHMNTLLYITFSVCTHIHKQTAQGESECTFSLLRLGGGGMGDGSSQQSVHDD